MKKKLTALFIAIAIFSTGLLAYGICFTCWFHDHSYMKASPALMDYVDSLELQWYLEDGYGGRIFAGKILAGDLEDYTVDCDISALSNGKHLFQYGQSDTKIIDFGYSTAGGGLPIWSDSESIRDIVDSGQSVTLVAVIRIKDNEGQTVYKGFVRSAPIEEVQQGGSGQPAIRPESKSEGSDKPQPEAEGRSR